jgi:hypothetical protein
MKLFKCQNCSQVLFFENRVCGRCGHQLGFLPKQGDLSALTPDGAEWQAIAAPGSAWRFCANAEYDVCNWLIPSGSAERFCTACRHNRMVPDLSVEANLVGWRKMEHAKHRLFYTLMRLQLPTPSRADEPNSGLAFDILADPPQPGSDKVMTGHENGIITVALAEADDPVREARRAEMGEPYRTLLGHFRHEIGHFYWDLLVRDEGRLDACRAVFGDDREDYAEALKRHYAEGAPPDWQVNFVSTYATTHAWEDFAETWAHYLHIVDSLETAAGFGLEAHPEITGDPLLHVETKVDPYQERDFDRLAAIWMPLTIALNAMNRSMGHGDLYPFVLSPAVIKKLGFIHDLVHAPRHRR